jgi:beta-lactamase superfamily II metal-dependent hydrolase
MTSKKAILKKTAVKKTAAKKKPVAAKKRVAAKVAAPAPSTPVSAARMPRKGEVRIRMYRQGLGDCFLLTFDSGKHILIDCGLLAGTPGGPSKIKEVAQHVKDTTDGKIDAMVVTHEHWDHVSGFTDARDIFEKLEIGETWVAWTEDPAQDIVVERRKANAVRMAAITGAVTRLGQSEHGDDQVRAGEIAQTMSFLGGFDPSAPLGAFSQKTDDAMSWATDEKRKPKYWSPGDAIQPDWLPGVSVRVLGPPKDQKALKKMDGAIGTDMYGMAMRRDELGFAAAVGVSLDNTVKEWLPFDPGLQWKDERLWLGGFDPSFAAQYRDNDWRRVDTEWLNSASDLALQLDNAVNNTSLVLAFEFGDGGDVLLFVGDAQVGNWLSWAGESEDLLKRTIFYKVGHHGSHNATLKARGLEAMTHKDLVAAIPVDEVFAKGKRPIPWMMPADKLYETLEEKTKGRILRVDKDFPKVGDRPNALGPSEWKQFVNSVDVDKLFIDFFCKPKG